MEQSISIATKDGRKVIARELPHRSRCKTVYVLGEVSSNSEVGSNPLLGCVHLQTTTSYTTACSGPRGGAGTQRVPAPSFYSGLMCALYLDESPARSTNQLIAMTGDGGGGGGTQQLHAAAGGQRYRPQSVTGSQQPDASSHREAAARGGVLRTTSV